MSPSPATRSASGFARDRSVRTKFLSVVVALGLVSGAVAVVASARIDDLSTTNDQLRVENVEPAQYLNSVQRYFQASRARVLEYGMVTADGRAEVLEQKSGFDAQIGEALDGYAPFVVDTDAAAALEDALGRYDAAATAIAPLADDGAVAYHDAYVESVRPITSEVGDALQAEFDAQAASAAARTSEAAAGAASAQRIIVVTLLVGLLAAVALALWCAGLVTRPLRVLQASAEALASGDLTRASGLTHGDEVGRTGAALDSALVSLRGVLSGVGASSDSVASASEELSASSSEISAAAEETSAQSGVVSAAAEEVSRHVSTVAAGAEQMGASIREIAQNTTEAARVATQAVTAAATATATVSKLGTSSKEIGDVVKTITSIAEQTNLLALNATIEAARAGEAGKGFAVVANEVKELAQETARATEDISRRVATIQADTTGAVAAIDEISSIIASINDFQTTIASAVEEQTATTQEMSRSVNDAATGSQEIALNITGVSGAAESTTQALTQTRLAVAELATLASDLKTQITRFTY